MPCKRRSALSLQHRSKARRTRDEDVCLQWVSSRLPPGVSALTLTCSIRPVKGVCKCPASGGPACPCSKYMHRVPVLPHRLIEERGVSGMCECSAAKGGGVCLCNGFVIRLPVMLASLSRTEDQRRTSALAKALSMEPANVMGKNCALAIPQLL